MREPWLHICKAGEKKYVIKYPISTMRHLHIFHIWGNVRPYIFPAYLAIGCLTTTNTHLSRQRWSMFRKITSWPIHKPTCFLSGPYLPGPTVPVYRCLCVIGILFQAREDCLQFYEFLHLYKQFDNGSQIVAPSWPPCGGGRGRGASWSALWGDHCWVLAPSYSSKAVGQFWFCGAQCQFNFWRRTVGCLWLIIRIDAPTQRGSFASRAGDGKQPVPVPWRRKGALRAWSQETRGSSVSSDESRRVNLVRFFPSRNLRQWSGRDFRGIPVRAGPGCRHWIVARATGRISPSGHHILGEGPRRIRRWGSASN